MNVDPSSYAITNYLNDVEQLEMEWSATCQRNGWTSTHSDEPYHAEFLKAEVEFISRRDKIEDRHFPGLDIRFDSTIQTPASAWRLIEHMKPVRRMMSLVEPKTASDSRRPEVCDKDVVRIYGLLHKIGVPWAPAPPYPEFTNAEADAELQRIANRLAEEDRKRYEIALAYQPLKGIGYTWGTLRRELRLEAPVCGIAEYGRLTSLQALRGTCQWRPDPDRMPGIQEVETLLYREFGEGFMSPQIVLLLGKITGTVSRVLEISVEAVDRMSLVEVSRAYSKHQQRQPGQVEANQVDPADSTLDQNSHALKSLLRVLANGVADERIDRAIPVLINDELTVNAKLEKISSLIPIPPTASAQQLAVMLKVSKTAIITSEWWNVNRKGDKSADIGRRQERMRQNSRHQSGESHDDD